MLFKKKLNILFLAFLTLVTLEASAGVHFCKKQKKRCYTPAQVSLIAPIQTCPTHCDVKGVRLNALYGKSRDVTGLDYGLVVNHATGDMTGLEMGPINVVEGDLKGVQLGNFYNRAKNAKGVRFAAVNHSKKDLTGVDLGLVNVSQGNVKGIQSGWVNVCNRKFTGIQDGLIFNGARDMRGLQVSRLFNQARRVRGVQLGLINVTHQLKGAQIGLLNFQTSRRYVKVLPFINISNSYGKPKRSSCHRC